MFKRNRREACRRAGVEPRIEELNGIDPVAYIISANIARRNLTKGQRAMWVAKAYPEARQGKKTSLKINEAVSGGYVRQARTVLRHAPTLADAVLAGAIALNARSGAGAARAPRPRLTCLGSRSSARSSRGSRTGP